MRGRKRQSIKIPKEEWKLGYIAGLIDGEGAISTYKVRTTRDGVQPRIQIYNSDKKIMDFLLKEVGGKCYYVQSSRSAFSKRMIYQWQLSSRADIATLLRHILPYLIVKREKAEEVLKLCE